MSEAVERQMYPPYSGEEPTCTKCFHVGASTEFMTFGRCSHSGRESLVIGLFANERLHRSCSNCGFAWDEAVRS